MLDAPADPLDTFGFISMRSTAGVAGDGVVVVSTSAAGVGVAAGASLDVAGLSVGNFTPLRRFAEKYRH